MVRRATRPAKSRFQACPNVPRPADARLRHQESKARGSGPHGPIGGAGIGPDQVGQLVRDRIR